MVIAPGAPRDVYYVDGARTHEVFAAIERESQRGRVVLRILERPFGSDDPRDNVTREETFEEEWEALLSLREFETRLASSGVAYARFTSRGVPEALAVRPRVTHDLEPERTTLTKDGKRAVAYKHFYQHASGKSRVDLAVPRMDLPNERYVLASFDFRFPNVEGGGLRVVHPRLAAGMLRQKWAEMQVELARAGYRRLVTPVDYTVALGPDWRERWSGAWKLALARLLDGDVRMEDEDAKPRAPVDLDVVDSALSNPLVEAVARRHLLSEEERAIAAGGELAIHRFIATRRKLAHHDEQVELSLLEAVLLARHQRARGKLDLAAEEAARVTRLAGAMGDAQRYLYVVRG